MTCGRDSASWSFIGSSGLPSMSIRLWHAAWDDLAGETEVNNMPPRNTTRRMAPRLRVHLGPGFSSGLSDTAKRLVYRTFHTVR